MNVLIHHNTRMYNVLLNLNLIRQDSITNNVKLTSYSSQFGIQLKFFIKIVLIVSFFFTN